MSGARPERWETTLAAVQEFARDWLGVAYREGGRDDHGIDCVGLAVIQAGRSLGFAVPGRDFAPGQDLAIMMELADYCEEVSVLCPGDLIGFDTRGDGKLWHFGLALGGGRFLHATQTMGVCVGRLSGPHGQMVVGYYRPLRWREGWAS